MDGRCEVVFKIGEMANLLKVSVKTLRYYDEAGIFRPDFVDEVTGYRSYSAGQITTANTILLLRDIGFSIHEIRYLVEQDLLSGGVTDMLELKEREIDQQIRDGMRRIKRIKALRRALAEEHDVVMAHYKITAKQLPGFWAVCLADELQDYSQQGHLWQEMRELLREQKIKTLQGCYTIYHHPVEPDGGQTLPVEIVKEVGAELRPDGDRLHCRWVEPGLFACLVHKGEHQSARNSYRVLLQWMEENNTRPAGSARELYLEDDLTTDSPMDYVTEIQIPIK